MAASLGSVAASRGPLIGDSDHAPQKPQNPESPRDLTLLANSSLVVPVTSSALCVDGLARSRRLEVDDVVAPQRAHTDPRRDVTGCPGGVSQGVPGDARPRRAWPAVHRRAVRRAVRGPRASSLVTGAAGAGAGAAVRRGPHRPAGRRCGAGAAGLEVRVGP